MVYPFLSAVAVRLRGSPSSSDAPDDETRDRTDG
jgi:hypothetical protein